VCGVGLDLGAGAWVPEVDFAVRSARERVRAAAGGVGDAVDCACGGLLAGREECREGGEWIPVWPVRTPVWRRVEKTMAIGGSCQSSWSALGVT